MENYIKLLKLNQQMLVGGSIPIICCPGVGDLIHRAVLASVLPQCFIFVDLVGVGDLKIPAVLGVQGNISC